MGFSRRASWLIVQTGTLGLARARTAFARSFSPSFDSLFASSFRAAVNSSSGTSKSPSISRSTEANYQDTGFSGW